MRRGLTPYPFIHHFWPKGYPSCIPSLRKGTPFHIPSLEHFIPFDCCKCTVFNPLSPSIQIQILQTDLHTFP